MSGSYPFDWVITVPVAGSITNTIICSCPGCATQELLNLRHDHPLGNYVYESVTAIFKHTMLFQRYNYAAFMRVVFLYSTFCALIVCVLIAFIDYSQSPLNNVKCPCLENVYSN